MNLNTTFDAPDYNMLHANPEVRKVGISGLLLDMILPEIYFATSINDFLDARRTIKPTSYLRSFGYTLPLRPGGSNLVGKALIYFFNFRYHTNRYNPNIINLEDHKCSLTVSLQTPQDHYKSAEEQGLISGDLVQMAAVLYSLRQDSVNLIGVRKILNIPNPDASRVDIKELMPALGFSY